MLENTKKQTVHPTPLLQGFQIEHIQIIQMWQKGASAVWGDATLECDTHDLTTHNDMSFGRRTYDSYHVILDCNIIT